MQITITNGCVEYDGEPILSEINFSIREKEKIAIVGRNGSGKTTLLKALTGEVPLVEGTGASSFSFTKAGNAEIGFLKQTFDGASSITLEEQLLSAYSEIIQTENDLSAALIKVQEDGNDKNVKRFSALNEKFEFLGGFLYKKEYKTAAKKFGFSDDDLKKPLREFSGGQRTKIALLTLLLSKPEVLLLDEPTNHLDLEATEWLEKYLSDYKNSFVIVSHDRMFLDKTVNVVYEIEYGEMTRYRSNYTDFVAQKKAAYEKALKDSDKKRKEIARLSALVERFRYKATKAKMAQAKLKQIERIGAVNAPVAYDTSTFKADFEPNKESVEKTLILEDLAFGYDKPLGRIDTIIKRGQKLGIVGKNGCGKSTLIKTLIGTQKPLSGCVKKGLHAEVGYFDQTMTQNFSPLTVFEDCHNEFPSLSDEQIRSALGAFGFSGEEVFKTVGDLSGGEKVRLALCKIFKKRPNVLVLDEPTNHMDIIGKESLEKMLAAYSGTVITVSHDRYFINKTCNRLAVFEDGGLKLYDCKYDEYEKIRAEKTAEAEESLTDRQKTVVVKKTKPVSSEKEKNKKLHRVAVLDEKIAALDKEKETLNDKLSSDPSIYSDYQKIKEITDEIERIDNLKQPLVDEWTDLVESLEE